MHKKPFSKQRFIAASASCTTKPLSQALTKCLKVIESQHRSICNRFKFNSGVNPMWIIHNSNSVHQKVSRSNSKRRSRHLRTYDFSTLYTSIPHSKLKSRIATVIRDAFTDSKKSHISIYTRSAKWTNKPQKNTLAWTCEDIIKYVDWLIDNIYVTFGDQLFRQVIGIPMGTDCAPFLANLFLFSYEFEWISKKWKEKDYATLQKYKNCSRYIDDLLMINNFGHMDTCMSEIYPSELELVPDKSNGTSVDFLDLTLTVDSNIISTKLYDKRDAFDFPIVNFPNLSGNIPNSHSYGVFSTELVRYARACSHFVDFRARVLMLIKKLTSQRFSIVPLMRTYQKFCSRHIHLILKYGIEVTRLHQAFSSSL